MTTAASIASYLDLLALDKATPITATGRGNFRLTAGTLRFLNAQPEFDSDLPAYRQILKAAVRAWDVQGFGNDFEAGCLSGLVAAIAELRDIDKTEAYWLVRAEVERTTPPTVTEEN